MASRWVESDQVLVTTEREIPYQVVRSRRALRPRLRMLEGGKLELVLPLGWSAGDASRLMRDFVPWIEAQLKKRTDVRPRALASGDAILLRGESVRIEAHSGRSHVERTGTTLRVRTTDGNVHRVVETWLYGEARRILVGEVASAEAALGVRSARVTVRDQRTRWGSCSTTGGLSFNWRLVLAPPGALTYVVVHEVAHLREHNHSPAFWALVEQHCPDYRSWREWLRRHGRELTIDREL